MTDTTTKRAVKRGGMFVTDAEIVERLGLPEKLGYQRLRALDENPRSGFPKKQEFWGNRRLWEDVEAYIKRTITRSL